MESELSQVAVIRRWPPCTVTTIIRSYIGSIVPIKKGIILWYTGIRCRYNSVFMV